MRLFKIMYVYTMHTNVLASWAVEWGLAREEEKEVKKDSRTKFETNLEWKNPFIRFIFFIPCA